ncbi:MAG: tRNA pseudouridine(55) synthase TruB, partial [Clostridia bacterium]|nr:tRNA pseudouridine(55) synthase TruB [Clostridia bacterium]
TLDPEATGVLPVMLGGATRFLEFLLTTPKQYRAVMKLGVVTDTLDLTGTVLETRDVSAGREEVLSALGRFRGDILQVPPMYSALKKDGVRLYDLARQGVEVEREARPVTIFELELLPDGTDGTDPSAGEYVLDVTCSGGTYIRTLIDDIGATLGCGASMAALLRTQVGVFTLDRAVTLEDLEDARDAGTLDERVMPLEEALCFLDAVTVTAPQGNRFRNGGELFLDRLHFPETPDDGALLRVVSQNQEFLGLGEVCRETGTLIVRRVFVNR